MLIVVAPQPAQAQTFQVLHNFTAGEDGAHPSAGVTLDGAGNLYGTTPAGAAGYGTVYELKHHGSGWTFNPLYSFASNPDGAAPVARVVFGPNGTLYGTTVIGGSGVGTVFNLRPKPTACTTALCPWTETQFLAFNGNDGGHPYYGDLLFDQTGNIYGTTEGEGVYGAGNVYELTPSGSGWTESVLHNFSGGSDGKYPFNGLIFDNAGNLYSTTVQGGLNAYGTVFKLTYRQGYGWTESTLYSFQGESDGVNPYAGLIFDQSGNLYGATTSGGANSGGTVFELTPSSGSWTLNTLYSFAGVDCGPWSTLVMHGGNLYGTTYCDGAYAAGTVFELIPSSGGGWTYTDLHDFTGGNDGGYPYSNVSFDSSGNLYGTTNQGGTGSACNGGCGVVWEITP
jgi:uncharacterized repeat protein (TIGR03803 family)